MLRSGVAMHITLVAFCLGTTLAAAEARQATMSKRGNIRFGPSTDAPVVVTLNPGTVVDVLGIAPGRDGWYQIRFPRQGHAWMHKKVLAPTDDPRVFRVTTDKARVRSDARTSSQMVDEMDAGDTVEWVGHEVEGQWIGRKVASWYAVHPPAAVAYVHTSVLDIDTRVVEEKQREAVAGLDIERLWQDARRRYEAYRSTLGKNPQDGLEQDWHGLARDLARVVDEHPTFRTRLMAKKLYAGIQRLMEAIQRSRQQRGLPAVGVLPDVPDPVHREAEREPATPADPPADPAPERSAPDEPVEPAVADDAPDAPDADHGDDPAGSDDPLPELPEAAERYDGWLVQKGIDGVAAQYALMDEQSQVSAVLKGDPAHPIQLSEFIWRRVLVEGSTEIATVTIDGTEQRVPVITVRAMELAK